MSYKLKLYNDEILTLLEKAGVDYFEASTFIKMLQADLVDIGECTSIKAMCDVITHSYSFYALDTWLNDHYAIAEELYEENKAILPEWVECVGDFIDNASDFITIDDLGRHTGDKIVFLEANALVTED